MVLHTYAQFSNQTNIPPKPTDEERQTETRLQELLDKVRFTCPLELAHMNPKTTDPLPHSARIRNFPPHPHPNLGPVPFCNETKQPLPPARQALGPPAGPLPTAVDARVGPHARQPAGQRARRYFGIPRRQPGTGRSRLHAGRAGQAGPQPRRGRQRAEPGVRGAGLVRFAEGKIGAHQQADYSCGEPGAGDQYADYEDLGEEEEGWDHHGVVYCVLLFDVLVLLIRLAAARSGGGRTEQDEERQKV